MIVHILRPDQRYIGQPIALCGKVVDKHDAQLARSLAPGCRECLALDQEDADVATQLQADLDRTMQRGPVTPDDDGDVDTSDRDEAEREGIEDARDEDAADEDPDAARQSER
jgi:hypothetical protein